MTDDLTTLDGLREAAWSRLEQAANTRDGPAHLIVLATVGATGAEARMVVLRNADRSSRTVDIWTNRYSAKFTEIEASPRGTLMFWDEAAALQVRLRVRVRVETDDAGIWEDLGPVARQNYATHPVPGEVIDTPQASRAATPDPSAFVRLTATIEAMDILHLGDDLHRRAAFDDTSARWLAP